MRERLPLALSATALTVALLGATPIGEAARGLVIPKSSVGTAQLKKGAVTRPKLGEQCRHAGEAEEECGHNAQGAGWLAPRRRFRAQSAAGRPEGRQG